MSRLLTRALRLMVNVHDVEAEVPPYEYDKFIPTLVKAQFALEEKYKPIHEKNGFPMPLKGSLDDRFVQDHIKHKAWCVIEELAECAEVMKDPETMKFEDIHAQEEFADALHFMLAIMAATSPWRYENPDSVLGYGAHLKMGTNPEYHLGLMCNTLKNKRWKTTHQQTDVVKFIRLRDQALESFLALWSHLTRFWAEDRWEVLHNLYFRKNAVNQFRQRSNY